MSTQAHLGSLDGQLYCAFQEDFKLLLVMFVFCIDFILVFFLEEGNEFRLFRKKFFTFEKSQMRKEPYMASRFYLHFLFTIFYVFVKRVGILFFKSVHQ